MIDQGVTAALAARDANRSTNDEDNHNRECVRRLERVILRRCTYQDFMKCQPLFFKGTEGVVKLTQWFKRMETVFRISNCTVENQIKFSHVLCLEFALTRTSTAVRTRLINMEVRVVEFESKRLRKYVGGLPDMIYGSVMASRSKTMHDAIEMETKLMDKKISTLAKRQAKNKRKLDNNNQAQQQSPKRQNVGQGFAAGTGERKGNARTLPYATWHYRSDCPELKNQNHGNQAEGTRARGLVHALGGGEADQDLNDMEDDISA
ncbi:hypothetical protein Tco_1474280 [Tanacetum coccineum]